MKVSLLDRDISNSQRDKCQLLNHTNSMRIFNSYPPSIGGNKNIYDFHYKEFISEPPRARDCSVRRRVRAKMQGPQFLDASSNGSPTHPGAPVKLLVAKCDRISLLGEGRCVTGGCQHTRMPVRTDARKKARKFRRRRSTDLINSADP